MKDLLKDKKKELIILTSIMLVLVIVTSLIIYGKYYATTNNKGVSVASGLYFGSNILTNIKGSLDIEDAKIDDDIPTYLNPEVWTGTTYTYPVEIRNYNSILLYNDSNLDMQYKVVFTLLDEDSATSYTVKQITADGSTNSEKIIEYGKEVSFTGQIKGGQPIYDKYEVSISIENVDTFDGKSAKILAVAYPTAPDYIAATAEDLRLATIIQGDYTQPKIEIDKSEFIISEMMNDANWLDIVKKYSGYEYNVTTTGDIASTGAENISQDIEITWSNVLTINQFDPYYIQAKDEGKVIVDDVNNTTTMTIDAKPYSNMVITFFKKDASFDFATLSGLEEFKGLVTTTLIEKSN